ncbi:MAG TPA: hypothetical protein VF006_03025 [Longimicrobium sp.]
MSAETQKPAGDPLEGVPKYARLALLALVAVAQAVPGYSILSADDWHPPDMGPVFAVTAVMVGAGMIGILFIARRKVLALRARVVVAICLGSLLLSLGLIIVYRTALDARVVRYTWAEQERVEMIPFGTSRWTNPVLLRRVRSANGGGPASLYAIRPSHLARTLEEYGPDEVQPLLSDGWRIATKGVLWTNYVAVLLLVAGAFGVAAVRLGHEMTPAKPAAAPEADADDAPAASPTPAASAPAAGVAAGAGPVAVGSPGAGAGAPPASVPAEVPWERRVAELEAELHRVRTQLGDARTAPSRNGHPREPLVVRAELRTSGWLLLGAAAMAWWISGRERESGPRGGPRTPG